MPNPEIKGKNPKIWMQVRSFQSSEHLAHKVLLTPKESVSWFLFLHVLFNATLKCRATWTCIKQNIHCAPKSLESRSTYAHRHRKSSPYSACWFMDTSVCIISDQCMSLQTFATKAVGLGGGFAIWSVNWLFHLGMGNVWIMEYGILVSEGES